MNLGGLVVGVGVAVTVVAAVVLVVALLVGGVRWVRRRRARLHPVSRRWSSAADRAASEASEATTVLRVSGARPSELSAVERDRRPMGPVVSSLPTPGGWVPREYRRAGGVFAPDGGVAPDPGPAPSAEVAGAPGGGVVLPVPGMFAESPTAQVRPVRPRDPA